MEKFFGCLVQNCGNILDRRVDLVYYHSCLAISQLSG